MGMGWWRGDGVEGRREKGGERDRDSGRMEGWGVGETGWRDGEKDRESGGMEEERGFVRG